MKTNGIRIRHYDILEQLGQGGMAVIYKAYDTRLEREVAIKVIRAKAFPAQQHERLFKRFEREAKAQAQFNHPNIVPVFDYGIHEGSPYLVMEHIPGGTLKDRIKGPMEYQQAIEWILPISDALQYAHEHGVVHRDVKPSNILINQENQPILTDFGIAKVLDTQDGTLTATGMGVGTPEYMAPEQWKGQSTVASDQYALGVVLYELLTGQKPYTAETPVAIALKQMNDPLPRPSTLAPGIPAQVEKVLFKALAKDPQDRYADMKAFQQALADAVGISVMSYQAEYEKNVEKPNSIGKGKKKFGWIWAVASITLVAVVIIRFLGFGDGWTNLLSKIHEGTGIGGDEKLSVVHATATPTHLPSPTKTPEPSPTITELPTITPTPKPVYSLNIIGDDSIYNYNIDTGKTEVLMSILPSDSYYETSNGLWASTSWAPNGNYVIYQPLTSNSTNLGKQLGKGLYFYDLNKKVEAPIIAGEAQYYFIGWRPDSNEFLFITDVGGIGQLFSYDVNSDATVIVKEFSGPLQPLALYFRQWSPDEENLLISGSLQNNSGVFIYNVKSKSWETIGYFSRNYSNLSCFWMPDGESVIFPGYDFTSLKEYDINTKEVSTIVNLPKFFQIFSNPDKNKIYIRTNDDLVYIFDLETTTTHHVKFDYQISAFDFFTWIDNSTILGPWIHSTGSISESGLYLINAENYSISYQANTPLDNDGVNDIFYYTFFLDRINDNYLIFNIQSGCLHSISPNTWNIDHQICFSVEEFNMPNFIFSDDKEYVLVRNGDKIFFMDVDTFEIDEIYLEGNSYSFSLNTIIN